jgi:hypothetical protein
VLDKYFTRARNRSKIAITVGFAWKNVPFHFSDRLMVGHTSSLMSAWAINEFEYNLDFSNFIEDYGNYSLRDMCKISPECLFWRDFARRLNRPSVNLLDSFEFARSTLLPLEPLLTHKAIKLQSLFDLKFDNNISFDADSWGGLYTDFDDFREHAEFIDNNGFALRDLLQKKIG